MREFDLLQHVYAANMALGDDVVIPPGDDMGAIRIGDQAVLVTVDQVADSVHVRVGRTPLELIGRKAIVRNLSDVAAMAAVPIGAVAAVSLPHDFGEDRATKLFDAMRQTAAKYDCPLVGGDISMWDHPLLISVTVFAKPTELGPVLRSGAKVGDRIYVTGELGGAWDEQGGGPHLTAEPRIALAIKLHRKLGGRLHSMIDLSDGLAGDLRHVCEQSNIAACIDEIAISCRAGIAVQHALADGEDYELCFTAAPEADVPAEIAGVPITEIGSITHPAQAGASFVTMRGEDGTERPIDARSWEHHG